MKALKSADGKYQAFDQDDDNFVVYGPDGPVWDRWSHEAGTLSSTPLVVPPNPLGPPLVPPPGSEGRIIRVTDEQDGELLNRGYSYWSQAWVSPATGNIFVFVGHTDGHPRFFRIDPETGAVHRPGQLVKHTGGEGWYWDARGYVYLCEGPRLLRVSPFVLADADTTIFDISQTHPGCRVWQAHSSDDGTVHSATVQRVVNDGPYPNIGTVVCREGRQTFYPAQGVLDESQVDGQYLIIKENDDNRIITLATGDERVITNAQGALGHSDVGHGFMVGENDQTGTCDYVDLATLASRRLFSIPNWNMGHISIKGGRGLLSDSTGFLSMVDLQTGWMQAFATHGMVGSGYDYLPHGNLSPCSKAAMWMSNKAGRMDAYVCLL